jgi:hypothetical protein
VPEPVSYVDVEETLMECSEPGAIRDEELIAFFEGEKVRPMVAMHLAHCQECSSRLVMYRGMERKLTRRLYRWDCPSNQILGEYQLEMLDGQLVQAVQAHLMRCVLCAAELATLTNFLTVDLLLEQRVKVEELVPAVSGQDILRDAFYPIEDARRRIEHVRDQALTGMRRIAAWLIPTQPGLAYQRGSTPQVVSWPRNYLAEDVTISLQLEQSVKQRGSLQLIGFVSRQGLAVEALQGTVTQLMTSEGVVQEQQIDDLGNVIFVDLAPALYTLEVHLPEGIVVIDQLAVQAQE